MDQTVPFAGGLNHDQPDIEAQQPTLERSDALTGVGHAQRSRPLRNEVTWPNSPMEAPPLAWAAARWSPAAWLPVLLCRPRR